MITEKLLSKPDIIWIDVQEPQDRDYERLNSEFSIPFLLIQDTLRPEHLPKHEESEKGHFLLLRSFDQMSQSDDTTVQELTRKIVFFITKKQLVTLHRKELIYLDKIAEKAEKPECYKDIHTLVHEIILAVIRSYENPLLRLQDTYDQFEEKILDEKHKRLQTAKIYLFRRQLFVLKRILKNTSDSLYRFKDFWKDHPSMLQDLRENLDQVYYQFDEISDNFDHLFQLHIALNDQRANDIMKVLTVFSTILLPLNFIASYYGMNFRFLPGLHSNDSWWIVTLSMFFISIVSILIFQKKGWFRTAGE